MPWSSLLNYFLTKANQNNRRKGTLTSRNKKTIKKIRLQSDYERIKLIVVSGFTNCRN